MEQRTPEWHALRKGKIGASDAPTILGKSPWQTRYQLWSVKTGRKKSDFVTNQAVERGNRWEDAARALYELQTGLELPPSVEVSAEHSFMMASLDGLGVDHKTGKKIVLEIKIPGREVFEAAKAGVVHEKYKAQCHHQRLVTGADEVHFWCCKVEKFGGVEQITDTALVILKEEKEYEKDLLVQLLSFWDFVNKDTPPPLGPRDVMILDDQSSVQLFSKLKKAKKKKDLAEKMLDAAKDSVAQAAKDYEELRQEAIEHVEPLNHPRIACLDVGMVKTKTGSWMVTATDASEKHRV